jgi:hypothetical protein
MSDNRADQFKADMAEMKLKTGGASKDGPLQLVGVLAMVAGIVIAFGAYMSSTGQSDPRDVQSLIIMALGGVALSVAGAAIYLRCALAKFLRVWLLRQIMENRAQSDALAERLGDRR